MQKLANLLARRRSTYSVLIGIVLLTLPCYIIGAIALAIAPRDNPTQPALRVTATATATVTTSATVTVFAPVMMNLVTSPTATLTDLPTQFVLSTQTPTATVIETPTLSPLPADVRPGKPRKRTK